MNPMPPTSPVSSWLVATVVPWLTDARSAGPAPSAPSALRMPVRKPSAGSAGVDGVLTASSSPESSSTATTSVNVPPVSMPTRIRLTVAPLSPRQCRCRDRSGGRQTLTIAPDRSGKITRTGPYNPPVPGVVYIDARPTDVGEERLDAAAEQEFGDYVVA